jgi:hypothetical protein
MKNIHQRAFLAGIPVAVAALPRKNGANRNAASLQEEISANDMRTHTPYSCSAVLWLRIASARNGIKRAFIINK